MAYHSPTLDLMVHGIESQVHAEEIILLLRHSHLHLLGLANSWLGT